MNSTVMQWSSLAMLMTICAGMVVMFGMLRHEPLRGLAGRASPVLMTMVLSTLVFLFAIVQLRSPYHHQGFIFPPKTEPWALAFSGACAGVCLFFLRGWHKGVYGSIEVTVAVIILIISALSMSANTVTTNTIAFLSAIYVLVRGLTNISEHLEARGSAPR